MKDADKVINVPMTRRLAAIAAVNAQTNGNKEFVDGQWSKAADQLKLAADICNALAQTE